MRLLIDGVAGKVSIRALRVGYFAVHRGSLGLADWWTVTDIETGKAVTRYACCQKSAIDFARKRCKMDLEVLIREGVTCPTHGKWYGQ